MPLPVEVDVEVEVVDVVVEVDVTSPVDVLVEDAPPLPDVVEVLPEPPSPWYSQRPTSLQ
jgi:hypothetical protein